MLPAPAGAAGECPPRPYPPEKNCSRVGAGRFGGRWGRRGGRRAKAAPALEAPEYRRTKASTLPQWVASTRRRSPGRPINCGWLGLPIWGRGSGTGECSARCLGWRLGARGAGVRIGSRPWPAGLGWRVVAAARRRPPIPAMGVGPRTGVGGYLRPGSRAR
jgi:hypothetical protein